MSVEAMHASLRENLRLLMQRKGLSQRGLSRLASLDETAVKQIMSGRSRSPRLDTVARLAAALDTTVARLIGDEPTDVAFYSSVLEVLDVLHGQDLLALDEQETRTIAAAIAEALALSGTREDSIQDSRTHVMSVVRNVMSLRKFRDSSPYPAPDNGPRAPSDGAPTPDGSSTADPEEPEEPEPAPHGSKQSENAT